MRRFEPARRLQTLRDSTVRLSRVSGYEGERINPASKFACLLAPKPLELFVATG